MCAMLTRLDGVRRKAQLRQLADTSKPEAKTRHAEWLAEIETRKEILRAQKNGVGQPLTVLDAIALAGRCYTWYVKQHEGDPAPEMRWRESSYHLVWDVIYPHARTHTFRDAKADPGFRRQT
jgi:hypothetical protein